MRKSRQCFSGSGTITPGGHFLFCETSGDVTVSQRRGLIGCSPQALISL